MAHHVVMQRRFGVGAAWVVATVVSILLASAAVATVRREISERPSPLRSTALDQLASSTTAPPPNVAGETPSGTIPSSTTTSAPTAQTTPIAPPTTVSPVTSTTTTIGVAPVTTTTAAPVVTTSTTTTTQAQGEPKSYELTGGFVWIFVFPDSVVVSGATPSPGFSVEIKKAGPPEVEVKFEGESHTSVFKAEIEDGVLEVDLSEEEEGGDG